MTWIVQELMNLVLDIVVGIGNNISKDVIYLFTIDYDTFERYIPAFADMDNIFKAMAFGIAFVILLLGLLKGILPAFFDDGENPWVIAIRFLAACVVIKFSRDIIDLEFRFFEKFYQALLNVDVYNSVDWENTMSVWTADTQSLSEAVITIFCNHAILINYIKLIIEVVERYVVICLGMFFSPVAAAFITSQRGSKVFVTYLKLIFSQCFLMCMNVLFIRGVYSIVLSASSSTLGRTYEIVSGDSATGNMMTLTLFILAFIKAGQKMDQYMKSLGLDVVQTGGALLDEVKSAAFSFAFGARTAAGVVSGLSRGGSNLTDRIHHPENYYKGNTGIKGFGDRWFGKSNHLSDAGKVESLARMKMASGKEIDANTARNLWESGKYGMFTGRSKEVQSNMVSAIAPSLASGIKSAAINSDGSARVTMHNGATGIIMPHPPKSGNAIPLDQGFFVKTGGKMSGINPKTTAGRAVFNASGESLGRGEIHNKSISDIRNRMNAVSGTPDKYSNKDVSNMLMGASVTPKEFFGDSFDMARDTLSKHKAISATALEKGDIRIENLGAGISQMRGENGNVLGTIISDESNARIDANVGEVFGDGKDSYRFIENTAPIAALDGPDARGIDSYITDGKDNYEAGKILSDYMQEEDEPFYIRKVDSDEHGLNLYFEGDANSISIPRENLDQYKISDADTDSFEKYPVIGELFDEVDKKELLEDLTKENGHFIRSLEEDEYGRVFMQLDNGEEFAGFEADMYQKPKDSVTARFNGKDVYFAKRGTKSRFLTEILEDQYN